MLGYGLENSVDLLSSAVVLWRFASPDEPKRLEAREKRASVAISITLFVLGISVASVAIDHLANHNEVKSVGLLLGLSIPSIMIFSVLALFKFKYADVLNSPALRKDGACSLCGAILSGGVFIGACLKEDAWWFDSTVRVVIINQSINDYIQQQH
jgi:divalent metal cation (Fe/Co/Zn/Cd) transporter